MVKPINAVHERQRGRRKDESAEKHFRHCIKFLFILISWACAENISFIFKCYAFQYWPSRHPSTNDDIRCVLGFMLLFSNVFYQLHNEIEKRKLNLLPPRSLSSTSNTLRCRPSLPRNQRKEITENFPLRLLHTLSIYTYTCQLDMDER